MKVEVVYQPNVLDPASRTSTVHEGDDLTIGAILPEGVEVGERGVSVTVERWHGDIPEVFEAFEPSEMVWDGDRVVVSVRPGISAAAAWQIVFAVASIATSALLSKSLAGKLGKGASDGKENESYRGFSNSFSPGGVIPLVLGERRIAPPVVGKVVESSFAPWILSNRETLKLLLAAGCGPIQGFGTAAGKVSSNADFLTVAGTALGSTAAQLSDLIGLKINGQNASNFSDVLIEWRTGEMDQDALPGFPDSSEDVVVDQALDEYSDSIDISDTGKAPGVYTSGNEIDDTLGDSASVTMTDPADRYVLSIFFPQGIYKDSGGGGLAPSTAKLRLQYWPVDSGGTRTGDTIILPEIAISGAEATPQVYYLPGDFLEPSTYAAAAQFGYLSCSKSSAYAKVSAPVNSATFPPSFADRDNLKFSAACWVFATSSAGGLRPIYLAQKGSVSGAAVSGIAWPFYPTGANSSNSGMCFGVERQRTSTGTLGPWQLCLYTWEGSTRSVRYSSPIPGTFNGSWRHVGMTWDATTNTLAFYVDGTVHSTATTVGTLKPAMFEEGDLVLGHLGTGGSAAIDDSLQSIRLCDIAVASEVKAESWFSFAANNQNAQGHTLSPWDPDLDPTLVFASHLSEEIASGKIEQLAFEASTTSGEVIETVGSPLQAAPQADAPVWSEASGTQTRGRYHLELFRSNAEASDPLVEVNSLSWKAVTLVLDEDFRHPGVSLFGVSIDADDQVNNAEPTVSFIERGAKVKIWDKVNADYPTFSEAWTRNPAWNIAYLITEEEVGIGAVWDIAKNFDLAAWGEFADYCEQGVEDAAGTPAFFDGDPVAASGSHPYGEVHFKIGILDNLGASTGEVLPETWVVGATVRIKTASDSSWLAASSDLSAAARLTITAIRWESDDTAANGYQHWVQIEADWVDGYTLPSASNVTGTAVGVEDRHQCDALLQERGADGWATVVELLRSFRAAPIIIGNKLSVYVDKARAVDWIVTEAQMEPGSFSRRWSGIDDRYNSVQLDLVDRLKDYETDFVTEDHPSISGTVNVASIRRAPPQTLRAVTRRTEARRQAIYLLNQWFLLRRAYTFRIGYEGVGFAVGDRILIAHDAIKAGFSGRVYEDASSATEIKLDRDVTLTNGNTYEVVVRSNGSVDVDGKEIRETVAIDASEIPGSGSTTIPAGTSITLASPGFQTLSHAQGDPYSFGEASTTTVDARIVRVTFDPGTLMRTVECIEYDADVFTDNTFGTLDTDPGTGQPPNGAQQGGIKRPGDNFGNIGGGVPGTKEGTRLGAGGKPETALIASWPKSFSASSGDSGGTSVYAATVEDSRPVTPQLVGTAPPGATSLEFSTERYRPGSRVRVFVQHRDSKGRARPVIGCPRTDAIIGGRALTPAAPTVTNPKSRQAHAVYSVTFPDGIVPEGVEVRVGGWILGQKVAHALRDGDLVSPQWVYGADNSESQGAYEHQVRSLLPNGQVSHAATFTNDDPNPLGSTVESSTAHEDAWASGTLSGLQIDSGYTPPALKFTGSGLEGTFETPTLDLGVAKRWLIEVAAKGHQVHPMVGADMTEPAASRLYANWLGEGPTGGEDALLSRVVIEWKPSDTGTPSSTWATFRPGEHYVRSAKFRLRVVRPTADFDCRIFRFGVRAIEIASFEPGDIDGGTL